MCHWTETLPPVAYEYAVAERDMEKLRNMEKIAVVMGKNFSVENSIVVEQNVEALHKNDRAVIE